MVGNISRIMTRHGAMSIAAAHDWDPPFPMDEFNVREVYFWKDNLSKPININLSRPISAIVFIR